MSARLTEAIMTFALHNGSRILSLDKPCLMGVLNVTPDSFSDGGRFASKDSAVKHARDMVEEGADILDIGGESTGIDSRDVSLEKELERVIPVIEAIRKENRDIWISIDTWKQEVAQRAVEAGADMVNDVTALRGDPNMAKWLASAQVPVVLMYSKDVTARTTGEAIHYEDVMKDVKDFLVERVEFAEAVGIAKAQIVLDPGMGAFVSMEGKYSLEILKRLKELVALEFPVLVGASRKGFIQEFCGGEGPQDRLEGSLVAAAIALLNGAHLIRAHDVKETKRVMRFMAGMTEL